MLQATFLFVLLLAGPASSWACDQPCETTPPVAQSPTQQPIVLPTDPGSIALIGVNAVINPGTPQVNGSGVTPGSQKIPPATIGIVGGGLPYAQQMALAGSQGGPHPNSPVAAKPAQSISALPPGPGEITTDEAPLPEAVEAARANSGLTAETPDAENSRQQAVALAETGDRAGALALVQGALAKHPDDKGLQAFVKNAQRSDTATKSVKDRAKELLAGLRGDSGQEPPPGAAILASPLPFSNMVSGAARPLSPAVLSAAGLGVRDGGLRMASPLVRDAASKFAIRDFPGAQSLLDRRLNEEPADASALRLRAFTLLSLIHI